VTVSAFLVLRWLSLLADVAVKGAALVIAASAAGLLLRRASAAARHLVWRYTMGGLLCLPLLAAALPGWQVHAWPQLLPAIEQTFFRTEARKSESAKCVGKRDLAAVHRPVRDPLPMTFRAFALSRFPAKESLLIGPAPQHCVASPVTSLRISPLQFRGAGEALPPAGLILLIWVIGVGVVLAPVGAAMARVRRWERRCRRVTEGALAMMWGELQQEIGLRQPVRLLMGGPAGRPVVPMTWGGARAVVLLPAAAEGWPADRLRAVLLHELAHVQRRDWPAQIRACAACALYWFHPLVWLAARQLRLESERACDDRVLTAGIPAPDYATVLLEIARSLRGSERPLRAALTMAARSPIEQRLRSILESGRSRCPIPPWVSPLAGIIVASVVVPLAAVRPVEEPSAGRGTRPAGAPTSSGRAASAGPERRVGAVEISERPVMGGAWIGPPRALVEIAESHSLPNQPGERSAVAHRRQADGMDAVAGGTVGEFSHSPRSHAGVRKNSALAAVQPPAVTEFFRPPASRVPAAGPRKTDSGPEAPAANIAIDRHPEQPTARPKPRAAPVLAPGAPVTAAGSVSPAGVQAAAIADAGEPPCPPASVRQVSVEDAPPAPLPASIPGPPAAAPASPADDPESSGSPPAPHLLLAVTGETDGHSPQTGTDGADALHAEGEAEPTREAPAAPVVATETQRAELWVWDGEQQGWTAVLIVWSSEAASPGPQPAALDGASPETTPAGNAPAPAGLEPEPPFWGELLEYWRQERERRDQAQERSDTRALLPASA
jgi:hypothetical protein